MLPPLFYMKGIFYLLTNLVLFTFICTGCKEKQGPSIRFLKTEFNLGTIVRNEGGVQTFDVHYDNIGSDTLRIISIERDCESCTTYELEEEYVLPGKSGVISITFDGSAFFSQDLEKTVLVYTNDTINPKVPIKFSAKIR